ncbi:hypothetical protein EHR_14135 [Enterococcus hirae ATCC 9790]|uniref:Uncharacterized protein n=1 Tax=Enterococcus hirae (strain ATCC 9790 / DSM 20160 / JCM 8729 / LMG 6399 / NBRC 3181 / NCIMB 6459 / NCDO 1258 / NCTC 12367 / WDCM 00089 / R) TaxID=768486 RepID=I6TDY4_ENTHA|nr:hypothetical protein EHR_14135 [Enterococcus hirae ATCC 9790]
MTLRGKQKDFYEARHTTYNRFFKLVKVESILP